MEDEDVALVNGLLEKAGIGARVSSIAECTASMFVALFEYMFNTRLSNIIREPQSRSDHIYNCQVVIDVLGRSVLQISLEHITGENVVNADKASVMNLVEIFSELYNIMEEDRRAGGALERRWSNEDDGGRRSATPERDLQRGSRTEDDLSRQATTLVEEIRTMPVTSPASLDANGPQGYEPGGSSSPGSQARVVSGRQRRPTQRARPMSAGGQPHPLIARDIPTVQFARQRMEQTQEDDAIAIEQRLARQRHVLAMFERDQERAQDEVVESALQEAAGHGVTLPPRPGTAPVRERLATAVHARQSEGLNAEDREIAAMAQKENVQVSEELLQALGVPHTVARHLMTQQVAQWKRQMKNARKVRDLGLEEATRRQKALLKILTKEKEVEKRQGEAQARVKAAAQAKQREYEQKRRRARLNADERDKDRYWQSRVLRRRDGEEKLFRKLFDECLKLQRDRLREERGATVERMKNSVTSGKAQQEALEAYYRDKQAQLDEEIRLLRTQRNVADKAQKLALNQLEREMKEKLRKQLDLLRGRLDAEDRLLLETQADDGRVAERVQRLGQVAQ